MNKDVSETVTEGELATIHSIYTSKVCNDLTGLEYCTGLTSIRLKTGVKDLSILTNCTKLSQLEIQTDLTDIDYSIAGSIPSLRTLYIKAPTIANISTIPDCSAMTDLEDITVEYDKYDTKELQGISGIAAGNNITPVSLYNCTNLKDITIKENTYNASLETVKILKQPTGLTLVEGKSGTLSVEASGIGDLAYQ